MKYKSRFKLDELWAIAEADGFTEALLGELMRFFEARMRHQYGKFVIRWVEAISPKRLMES
ncbi:MAG: hypothetical protein AAGD09_09905 [Cyanobacteria bacterium P01_F01_bin.56]